MCYSFLQMFVELDELTFCDDGHLRWVEKCRWIKYEENVEEAAER
jgi:solute carrier family 4 anion exchanger 3